MVVLYQMRRDESADSQDPHKEVRDLLLGFQYSYLAEQWKSVT